MKYSTLSLLILLYINCVSQDTTDTRNYISFGLISPYEVDGMAGMDALISDDGTILFSFREENSKSYQKFGMQAKYYRTLGTCQLGFRFGISNRTMDESRKSITYDYDDPTNTLIDQVTHYTYEYSQANYIGAIGIRGQANLGLLSFSGEFLGLFSTLGSSKQVYRQTNQYYNSEGIPEAAHSHTNYYWDTDPGWMLGPGGEITAGIVLFKNLSISAGIGMYFLYTQLDGEIIYKWEYVKDDPITHVMLEDSFETETTTLQMEHSSWSFSRPVLSLEIGVSF